MSKRKQFIFKNQTDAENYLESISKEILPIFKKLPKFSKYTQLEKLAHPLEKEINKILSKFNGVVGSTGYCVTGNRSLNPLTKLRINSVTKEQAITIPVDFSIWASFEYGYVNFTFSNIFNNEKITNEYFNYSGSRNGSYFILEKVYDRIQSNYGVSSIRVYKDKVYFKKLQADHNTESPDSYLKETA